MAKSFKVSGNKPNAGVFMCFTSGKTFTLQAMKRTEDYKWVEDKKGEKYNFRASDLPDNVGEDFLIKNGAKYFCRISEGGDELLDIRPSVGNFKGKFIRLAEDSDGNIFVNEKEGKWGNYQQFVAEIEVVDHEKFDGVIYPKYVAFTSWDKKKKECVPLFGEDDGELTYGATKQLQEFFEFSGLADPKVSIAYDEDLQVLLTNISNKLRKVKNVFNFSVENGYPAAITAFEDWDEHTDDDEDIEDEEDDVEEEVEEAPKAKKKRNFDD
jgi:hypothetical protein